MEMPAEYVGREQSWVKHRVLQEYLIRWGRKLGSMARTRPVTLWYVDCFSGPWKNVDEDLKDTSIHIGLEALSEATTLWRDQGAQIASKAIFVEKDKAAYAKLRTYLDRRTDDVEKFAFHGQFGSYVERINQMIGRDPAFVFVDPTGWDGVAMKYIQGLTANSVRDVLINVMFNHINRFKDDSREFLRRQMADFFGLGEDELPPGLGEVELLRLYRSLLKQRCGISFAADLAVPHPTQKRTWFRLVIGGAHREVVRVFREVEAKIVGGEAAVARTLARQNKTASKTGQMSLLGEAASPEQDPWYAKENERDRNLAAGALLEALPPRPKLVRFDKIWPELLQELHLTPAELGEIAFEMFNNGELDARLEKRRRSRLGNEDLVGRL